MSFFTGCFRGWKSTLRMRTFFTLSILDLCFPLCGLKSLLEPFLVDNKEKPPFEKFSLPFEKPFLPPIFFGPQFGVLCLLFTKECSSGSPESTAVLHGFEDTSKEEEVKAVVGNSIKQRQEWKTCNTQSSALQNLVHMSLWNSKNTRTRDRYVRSASMQKS